MKILVKFQENWRGCPDHFMRIDTEWPTDNTASALMNDKT